MEAPSDGLLPVTCSPMQRDATRRMCQSREARLSLMSNIHKRIPFANSDGPLVQMVRLVLIENEVIPMVLLVQNKFSFRASNSSL